MIWLGIIIGYLLGALGNYFLRRDDLRDLKKSREVIVALQQLRLMEAEMAHRDVYRWKCVAMGEEWNPEKGKLMRLPGEEP